MILAVMSDLHVGLAARAKDLCPEPPANKRKNRTRYNSKSDDAYAEKFLDFIRRDGEEIRADYLILPGDLTNAGKPSEVKIASKLILQAADALGVAHDKIVFTPGNHDLDWSRHDLGDDTGISWGDRYNALGHSTFHFREIIDRGIGDVLAPPYFIAWTFDDLITIAYNSSSQDNPLGTDHIHHGFADPDHIDALRAYLQSITIPDDTLRLFLVHHHPLDFSDPIPSFDFSLMQNADNLLDLLHEFRFDLIIHGHKHHPRFETHTTSTYPHLPILCSGSFSVEIDTQWSGTVENQFHLVEVNGRTGTENRIQGNIVSWANNRARGWIPSDEFTHGIHHISPFGNYVMPDKLDALIESFIRTHLYKHPDVQWKHVLDEFPHLEHLPAKSAEAAFSRLATKFDYDFFAKTAMHQLMLSGKE